MTEQVTPIRQVHRDLTRERILEAAAELMAETMDIAVPTADIGARAGVAARTVYRHFPSRELLDQAVWPRVVARMQMQGNPVSVADLVQMPRRIFPNLDQREGLVRAALHSEVARQTSQLTNPSRQAAMLACSYEALPDLDDGTRRRRAAVLLSICSAQGWEALKDLGGLSGEEAGLAASEAIAVLLGLQSARAGGLPFDEDLGEDRPDGSP
ncbi:putative transcriptional regulator protein, TetR family [Novosphingobium sp. KN65.2]|nr:putative transcriptional regulator protein, TetR family [Novosphingobium sp. KN65.2]